MTRTERPAALQDRAVGLLLHMQVRLHGDRLPAADRVDGDLLVLRAADGEEKNDETRRQTALYVPTEKRLAAGTFKATDFWT